MWFPRNRSFPKNSRYQTKSTSHIQVGYDTRYARDEVEAMEEIARRRRKEKYDRKARAEARQETHRRAYLSSIALPSPDQLIARQRNRARLLAAVRRPAHDSNP